MTITIDPTQTFQTIEGIGASLAWAGDPIGQTWSEAAKTRLADPLFCPERGAGLSGVRFNIGAGGAWAETNPSDPWRHPACFRRDADAPFDPDVHAGQQWFVRAAADRGATCRVAFANSPPVWLTRNGRATHDTSQRGLTTNLIPRGEADFAAFLADVVAHFDRIGLPFTALSPVNEPQWAWEDATQEGCRFDNDGIVALAHAVRAELDRRALAIELDWPEAADLRFLIDDDLRRTLPDPGREDGAYGRSAEQVRELAGICEGKICGHGYWTYDPPEQSRQVREAVRATMQRHVPGGRFWQSEVCIMEGGRDVGMNTALRVARLLHDDFVFADASAWFWWLALSPYDFKDGLVHVDPGETIVPTKTLWALGHFSRFVRPGWQRIACDPGDETLFASAYRGPDGDVALVVINASEQERLVDVGTSGVVTTFLTDADRDLAPVERPASDLRIPPRAIQTILFGTPFAAEERGVCRRRSARNEPGEADPAVP